MSWEGSLRDLGEEGLLSMLRKRIPAGRGVLLGPGDDAALLEWGKELLCLTTDMYVEGVHFDLSLLSAEGVGFRCLAGAVSDLAAMGAEPLAVVVGFGAPGGVPASVFGSLLEGILQGSTEWDIPLVGGDLVSAPVLVLGFTALGRAERGRVLLRSRAVPGDLLCVTGPLGGAAAGLALLKAARDGVEGASELASSEKGRAAIRAHARPRPRLGAGRVLAAAGVTAAMDVSDGLGIDAFRMARESGVRVEIASERVPLAPGVREVAALLGLDPLGLALGGGEEYELLFAVAPDRLEEAEEALRRAGEGGLLVVGEVLHGEGAWLRTAEGLADLASFGFEHYRSGRSGGPEES